MPDARFFETLSPLTVAALAAEVGGEVERGGDRLIASVAPLSSADGGAIAFLGDRKFADALAELAQVHGWRGDTSIQERLEHDLYYIQKWSFWLDLRILAMTLLRLGRPARAAVDRADDSATTGSA